MTDNLNELEKIKNRLSNSHIDSIELMGVIVHIIYSKMLFPKNNQLESFVSDCLNIQIPNYVLRSRTLISAKISKYIYNLDEVEVRKIHHKLKLFFENYNVENSQNNKGKKMKNRKKNENDKLDTWLKGL